MIGRLIPDKFIPKDLPKGLVVALIYGCLFLGASGFRQGRGNVWQGFLHAAENWLLMLVIIPCCTALIAAPIKYRDDSFDLRLAYFLGMFVAFLFMLGKLRYWR